MFRLNGLGFLIFWFMRTSIYRGAVIRRRLALSAIVVANWKVQKAARYKPYLQKMRDRKW
jgi:hypothetical protein